MSTHIALLRAINVGGRYVKMADLRACLTAAGLTDVETYIQTGNVRFATSTRSKARIERYVEDALADGCGFPVPAIVFTCAELSRVYDDAMALDSPLPGVPRRYVTFLKSDPPVEAVREVGTWELEGERAQVVGRAVHVWLTKSAHEARLTNARFEKTLGLATTRDLNVVRALSQRWSP